MFQRPHTNSKLWVWHYSIPQYIREMHDTYLNYMYGGYHTQLWPSAHQSFCSLKLLWCMEYSINADCFGTQGAIDHWAAYMVANMADATGFYGGFEFEYKWG